MRHACEVVNHGEQCVSDLGSDSRISVQTLESTIDTLLGKQTDKLEMRDKYPQTTSFADKKISIPENEQTIEGF